METTPTPLWPGSDARAGKSGGEGVATVGGGRARDVAGRGDERPAAAGPDSAVRLFGATGIGGRPQGPAAGGSAPGRQPPTAHVQAHLTHDNLLLQTQHELGRRNRVAVGNVLRTARKLGRAESPEENSPGQSESASDALGQPSTKFPSPERAAEISPATRALDKLPTMSNATSTTMPENVFKGDATKLAGLDIDSSLTKAKALTCEYYL